ncbi:MAG: pentapeptide repeat-containing protein, partial [Bradymonadaceae bacterium]
MSDDFVNLIQSGNTDEFNRRIRERERDDRDLPSMMAETFDEAELSGFDFSALDLSYCEFADSTLTDLRFDEATLEGAYFHGCTIIDCSFAGANLEGAALESCTFSKCDFPESRVADGEWSDCQFQECLFADLEVGDGAEIERTEFEDGRWQRVDWGESLFRLVTLRSVGFEDVDLDDLEVKNCYVSAGTASGLDLPEGFVETL